MANNAWDAIIELADGIKLPIDVIIGAGTFKKGVKVGTMLRCIRNHERYAEDKETLGKENALLGSPIGDSVEVHLVADKNISEQEAKMIQSVVHHLTCKYRGTVCTCPTCCPAKWELNRAKR